ncbi:hypothetical protein D3C78_1447260 [compost metagenome]
MRFPFLGANGREQRRVRRFLDGLITAGPGHDLNARRFAEAPENLAYHLAGHAFGPAVATEAHRRIFLGVELQHGRLCGSQ